MAKEKKQFRELSDEELKLVTGGAEAFDIGGDCSGAHQHEFEMKCVCDLGYHHIEGHICEKD